MVQATARNRSSTRCARAFCISSLVPFSVCFMIAESILSNHILCHAIIIYIYIYHMYVCVYLYRERWIVCSDACSSVSLIVMVRQPLSMYRAVPGMSKDPFNQACAKDCTTWSVMSCQELESLSLFLIFFSLSFFSCF